MQLPELTYPERVAAATIRGYLMQAHYSVLRWLDLKDDQAMLCEGDEDIDQYLLDPAGNVSAIKQEQIKDLAGRISARDPDAYETIFNFLVSFHTRHAAPRCIGRAPLRTHLTAKRSFGLLAAMPKTPKESSADVARVPFTNTDGQAAFLHFLSLAEARVAAGKLPRPARDISVVRVNVSRGVAALLSREAAIRAKMPAADFAPIAEIPALAAALDFAAGRVPVEMSDGEIGALLAEVRPLRKLALTQLDVFASLSLVPADRVATIRSGSGPLDTARDAVAIAGLFAEFSEAIAGKHPFTAEQLATLADLGNRLVRAIAPTAAKEGPATTGSEAALRDAFYGEVLERYETARELGVIGFGLKELDAQVPPAHARTNAPKKTKKDGSPE